MDVDWNGTVSTRKGKTISRWQKFGIWNSGQECRNDVDRTDAKRKTGRWRRLVEVAGQKVVVAKVTLVDWIEAPQAMGGWPSNVIGDVKLNKRITSSEKARTQPGAKVGRAIDWFQSSCCFEKGCLLPSNWETKQPNERSYVTIGLLFGWQDCGRGLADLWPHRVYNIRVNLIEYKRTWLLLWFDSFFG